ncbi:MAG TPA: hypothetical protein PL066_00030 [bacterium]|nr:hypothetical protein [bacterium]
MQFFYLKPECLKDQYQEHFPVIKNFLEFLLLEIEQDRYFSTNIPADDFSQFMLIKKGQKLIKQITLDENFSVDEQRFNSLLKTAKKANTELLRLHRLMQNFERVLIVMEMLTPYHPMWFEMEEKLRCKMDIKGTHLCGIIAAYMRSLDTREGTQKAKFLTEIESWKKETSQFFDFPETAIEAIKKARQGKLL